MTQEAIALRTSGGAYPGLEVVQDVNKALDTIATDFAGPSDPAALAGPYMTWADTGNMLLKRRNAANTGWVVEDTLLRALAFRYKAIGGQVWTSAAWTRVNVGDVDYDPGGVVTDSVAQPQVPGYYLFTGVVHAGSGVSSRLVPRIYKNGTGQGWGCDPDLSAGGAVVASNVSSLMYMNGTTDTAELYVFQAGTGKPAGGTTEFSGVLIRAA